MCMESCVFVCEDFPSENRMQASKTTHIVKLKIAIFIHCFVVGSYSISPNSFSFSIYFPADNGQLTKSAKSCLDNLH